MSARPTPTAVDEHDSTTAKDHADVIFAAASGSEAFFKGRPWEIEGNRLVTGLQQPSGYSADPARYDHVHEETVGSDPESPKQQTYFARAEAPLSPVAEVASSDSLDGQALADAIRVLNGSEAHDLLLDNCPLREASSSEPDDVSAQGLDLAEVLRPMGLPDLPEQVHGYAPFVGA